MQCSQNAVLTSTVVGDFGVRPDKNPAVPLLPQAVMALQVSRISKDELRVYHSGRIPCDLYPDKEQTPIMVNFTMHVPIDRLMEFARIGRPSILSLWEQKHLEDCIECLRTLISALETGIEKKKTKVQSIR